MLFKNVSRKNMRMKWQKTTWQQLRLEWWQWSILIGVNLVNVSASGHFVAVTAPRGGQIEACEPDMLKWFMFHNIKRHNNKSQDTVVQHISQPGGTCVHQPEEGSNNSH